MTYRLKDGQYQRIREEIIEDAQVVMSEREATDHADYVMTVIERILSEDY